ncbi:unnamed protein product [Arctia plantaginis]|uniref:Uncharacterized protein n=1 Tax=Arctia plantaginis TaxID=874455 RepID=A0A8S0YV83_ARCPL|nr:unnamed protein product [Arctia plantaginis]CAB3235676.1 unnamed protein product [Arctia plantaginis]
MGICISVKCCPDPEPQPDSVIVVENPPPQMRWLSGVSSASITAIKTKWICIEVKFLLVAVTVDELLSLTAKPEVVGIIPTQDNYCV